MSAKGTELDYDVVVAEYLLIVEHFHQSEGQVSEWEVWGARFETIVGAFRSDVIGDSVSWGRSAELETRSHISIVGHNRNGV